MRARAGMVCAVAILALASGAAAQGVRGSATATARLIELRALQADTIDPTRLVADGSGGYTLDGRPIACRPQVPCVRFLPGARQQAVAFTQDVRLTAWGLGVRGLSATAFLRTRANGGDFALPRADDAFDALVAYVEYDRAPFRVRAGRQSTLGGLGFASFDGASVLIEPRPGFSAEAYGGRSLARGLSEPRAEVLRGFESFVPDPDVLLFGGAVDARPLAGVDFAVRYQREIFADRSGLASERASAEAVVSALAPVTILAAADYDFAFGRIGRADLRLRVPVSTHLAVEALARRYVPYFELWTIWGFFDPVGYHEAEAFVAWNAGTSAGLVASGGLRRYQETRTAVFGPDLERDTRRISASAWWQPAPMWRLDAVVRRETGFGASYGGGDLSLRWGDPDRLVVRPWLTAFEQVEEFRLGQGTVVGGGADLTLHVADRWTLEGGAALFHHTSTRYDTPDWDQRRAWLSARVEFGRDPGRRLLRGTS